MRCLLIDIILLKSAMTRDKRSFFAIFCFSHASLYVYRCSHICKQRNGRWRNLLRCDVAKFLVSHRPRADLKNLKGKINARTSRKPEHLINVKLFNARNSCCGGSDGQDAKSERTCNAHTWNWKAHASKTQSPLEMVPVPIGNLQLQTWLSACTGHRWLQHWSHRYCGTRLRVGTCTPQHQSWRCIRATETLGRTTPLGCCWGNLQGFKVQVTLAIHKKDTN